MFTEINFISQFATASNNKLPIFSAALYHVSFSLKLIALFLDGKIDFISDAQFYNLQPITIVMYNKMLEAVISTAAIRLVRVQFQEIHSW